MIGAQIQSRRPPRSTAKRRVQAEYPLAYCTFTNWGVQGRFRTRVRVGHQSFAAIAKTSHDAWKRLELVMKSEGWL